MIHVVYYRSDIRLTVQGHAHSAEPGHDLVCAGVSALAYTLAANVFDMKDNRLLKDVIVKLEPGDAEICCIAKNRYKGIVGRIFQAVCVGFEMLAESNPEYISYEIHS